jgi:hypothetical protein|nr:MAG TPA: YopX protein [Caudoviricetes sp.]
MILKYRAWHKTWEEIGIVKRIRFDDDGNATTVLFIGKHLGENAKIDNFTLMQSTGLFDKNGKEIFEGDVIAIEVDDTETPINARVFQNSKIGVLMFHVFEDNEDVPMVELLEDNSVAFEIIGNIYETPELLEEK